MTARLLHLYNSLFPLWAVLLSLWAFHAPAAFSGFAPAIVPMLALVMFFMGLNLGVEDFRRVGRAPRPVLIGLCLQFLLMPSLAWLIALVLQLPQQLAVGLILVGCCAGGTASNVICYLARGNVALSISMTLMSTLVGVLATPLLCRVYVSQAIEVDRWSMVISLCQMVVLPVLAGILCNHFFRRRMASAEPLLAALSITTIIFIIAIIVALNRTSLASIGVLIALAVVLHNGLGFAGGYACGRLLGLDLRDSRTVAIEVGMQNSGLGVALALKYFSPLAALPGAVFSVWHNIAGAALAGYWRYRRPQRNKVRVAA
jgi:BASS family bile acid:Na+ symporter